MKRLPPYRPDDAPLFASLASPLATILIAGLAACAVGVDGPVGDGGYAAGYYEPAGVVYGAWGEGYRVGPVRGGDRAGERGRGEASHAYRPAPQSRATPSIPSHGTSHGTSHVAHRD